MKKIDVYLPNNNKSSGIYFDERVYVDYQDLSRLYNLYGKWVNPENSYKILHSNASLREVKSYTFDGNYLNFDRINVENWNVSFDSNGIPKTNFRWGTFYYPITIAHYGLQKYSLYIKDKDNISLENEFINIADWFIDNQSDSGAWLSEFDHTYYKGRTEIIKGPWSSALGQGMAISVLVRAHLITGKSIYLETAKKAFNVFLIPVDKGGVLTKFENKYLFYEEYPTNPESFVLNGFMYALLGLYDLKAITGDNLISYYYNEGIKTLKRMLPLYDLGNRTAYDLTHYTTNGEYPNVARWGYHVTHIYLLMALNCVESDEQFNRTINRWTGYMNGLSVKEN